MGLLVAVAVFPFVLFRLFLSAGFFPGRLVMQICQVGRNVWPVRHGGKVGSASCSGRLGAQVGAELGWGLRNPPWRLEGWCVLVHEGNYPPLTSINAREIAGPQDCQCVSACLSASPFVGLPIVWTFEPSAHYVLAMLTDLDGVPGLQTGFLLHR
ncbi:hypothetical protein LZ30DRAFT_142792 [Colletotrichum cereale]|nr:hypothetical protein LZ30DRAFT_142792 [Colletotrichum cereale]